jgi:hypothetical protein
MRWCAEVRSRHFSSFLEDAHSHLCWVVLRLISYVGFLLLSILQVYTLGTILSMQISFVGFQPVQSSEHMAVSTVFDCVSWLIF